jgi:hypothetical protein
MTTTNKSRILLTVLIVGAMLPGLYLLSEQAYMIYGLILVLGGAAVLFWLWKPGQGSKASKKKK